MAYSSQFMRHLVYELSELEQRVEGRAEMCVVRMTGVCVQGQSLKQSHILLHPPHWAQQQLL